MLLATISVAGQAAMLQGNAQRSRVFATQSADVPPRQLLWQAEKLFRLKFSESYVNRLPDAVIYGELSTGHSFTPPLISGDTIFFSIYQGDSYFYAVDAVTGKQIVTLKFENNALSLTAAIGSVAYFGTATGVVNAYDASTQKLKWSFEAKDTSFNGADPAIVDGVLYISGYGSGIYALTADKGTLLWQFKFDKPLYGPAIQGDDVIVRSEKTLIALDKKTGAKKWESNIGRLFLGPSILGDQIFVRHLEGEIRAYALKDGALRWQLKKNGGTVTNLALFNDVVIYGEEYGNLVALDARTGLEKWRFKTKKRCRNPIVAGTTVYSRCDDHYLYALDAESGVLSWSFDSRASGSTPMIAGGILYSLSSNGVLQAFR